MRCLLLFLAAFLSPTLCSAARSASADSLRHYFEAAKVRGSFVLYNLKDDRFTVSNTAESGRPFIPASTFKICNSLIGLETGVVPDEHFVQKWDGVDRSRPAWNKDQDMQEAFRNSTVWYYQEVARRIGARRMKEWLDKAGYGNADTTGGIDRFWLTGKLRITPAEQIDFLRRLHDGTLPFSRRTMDIVRKMMVAESTQTYVLRAKTGWSEQDGEQIGWYVGYVTTADNVYYFATCIHTPDADIAGFGEARIGITRDILRLLRILP